MDELTKYAADVIEFIAGGILFLCALLVWGYLWVPGTLNDHLFPFAEALGQVSSLALGIALLGLTYTLGVFAEGTSRVVTEWRLRHLTSQTMREEAEYDKADPAKVADRADSHLLRSGLLLRGQRYVQFGRCPHCRRARSSDSAHAAAAPVDLESTEPPVEAAPTAPQGPAARPVPPLCTKHRTTTEHRVRQTMMEELREQWRSVAARSEAGAKAIDGQLKRLRIERTLVFSIVLMTLALGSKAVQISWFVDPPEGIDPPSLWALAVAGLILALVAWHLVNQRFERFLGAIVRNYRLESRGT